MIIDDERPIRNLLKLNIAWKELELELVGEAASGIEAINMIDDVRPNIVFVDIRMPFMNGIEFSKLAAKRYPKLKIIVLTAFNEFKNALECIGIGVSEYLLKPIVQEFGFNSCNLNHRFKADLGINLIDYITKCRMEKAIECLKLKKRMYITASEVGIPDPNYFGMCFKKYTGVSYTDLLNESPQE
jgi:YesN/AraC family two-component response regulator